MNIECGFCQSLNFQSEKPQDNKFSNCCNKGKVILEPLGEPDDLYKSLFDGRHPESKNFLENIRNYNSALAFASMSAKLDPFMNTSGPYFYKVSGQVYHYVSESSRSISSMASYSQLYMLDSKEATLKRTNNSINSKCINEVKNRLIWFQVY
jgi:hypothetical protein